MPRVGEVAFRQRDLVGHGRQGQAGVGGVAADGFGGFAHFHNGGWLSFFGQLEESLRGDGHFHVINIAGLEELFCGTFDLAPGTGILVGLVARKLKKQLDKSAEPFTASHSITGNIRYEQSRPSTAKSITDEIDRVLTRHYGFTAEELDFILNYDIKYRLGRDGGEED